MKKDKNKVGRWLTLLCGLAVSGAVCLDFDGQQTVARAADPLYMTPGDCLRVADTTDPLYANNRGFVCGGQIEKTGDRLWSATVSGGTTEPHVNNYMAVVYSDDFGKTWRDPFLAIDNQTYPDGVRVYDGSLWCDPYGKLWIFYNQTAETWGTGNVTSCVFAFVIENPTADPDDMRIVNKGRLFDGMTSNKPAVIDVGGGKTRWVKAAHMNWTTTTDVFASDDKGETWRRIGGATGVACGAHESSIVQLSDGTLMMQKRIDEGKNGGLELSYSDDYGVTWSTYENNLAAPLRQPGSRTALTRLPSGHILFVGNSPTPVDNPSSMKRDKIIAYLSTDDGDTFPYSLTLDDRNDVSYPDVTVTDDGKIYVCWDKGRTNYSETRFSMFTEADVIAGRITSSGITRRPIFKNTRMYNDIVSFSRFGGIPDVFAFGTSLDDICYAQLNTMTVTTTAGAEYELTGSWSSPDFVANRAGTYRLNFTPDSFPNRVEDVQDILHVTVTVLEENAVVTTGIKVDASAVKKTYAIGETLDTTGLVVKAEQSDGGKRTLQASEYTVTGFDSSTAGSKTVTVSYETYSSAFSVTVKAPDDSDDAGGNTDTGTKKGCGGNIAGPMGGMASGLLSLAVGVTMIRRKRYEK